VSVRARISQKVSFAAICRVIRRLALMTTARSRQDVTPAPAILDAIHQSIALGDGFGSVEKESCDKFGPL
jgi:hypothetical protein